MLGNNFLEPKFNFKGVMVKNILIFLPRCGATALFCAWEGRLRHSKHIFLPISPQPVELQTSILYQIVALNMLMKKGHQVHGPKFYILRAGSQNANLPAKMLKIAVFRPGPPQDIKNYHFFWGEL